MEAILNYENMKEIIVYVAFGSVVGYDLFWLGFLIVSGVKWLKKKIKSRKNKKEGIPNE